MKMKQPLTLSLLLFGLICSSPAKAITLADYNTDGMKPLKLYLISRQETFNMAEIDTEIRYRLGEFSSQRHFVFTYDWLSGLSINLSQGVSKPENYLFLSYTLSTASHTAIYLDNQFHSNFSDLFITYFSEIYRDSNSETAIAINLEPHYLLPYSSGGSAYGLVLGEVVFRKMVGSQLSTYLGYTYPWLFTNSPTPYVNYVPYSTFGLDYWMTDGYSLACHYNGLQWVAGLGFSLLYYYVFIGTSIDIHPEVKFSINLVY